MKKIIVCIVLLSASFTALNGQSTQYIGITPDARSAAMGETGISASGDAFSIYHYGAAVALQPGMVAAGYSYTPWSRSFVEGYNLHTAAAYFRFAGRHAITAGFRYFSSPWLHGTDNNGNPTAKYKPMDMAVDIGYAYAITNELGVAAAGRYVISDPNSPGTSQGNAFAVDVSAYYRKNNLSAGIALSNLGTKMNYGGDNFNMPANVKLGGAYRLPLAAKHALTGALEVGYNIMPSDQSGIFGGVGLEYMFNKLIAVRGGYHLADNKVSPSYATVGCGVNLFMCSLDFSYLIAGSDSQLRNTMRISLGVKF